MKREENKNMMKKLKRMQKKNNKQTQQEDHIDKENVLNVFENMYF